jgi:hypothetical protein
VRKRRLAGLAVLPALIAVLVLTGCAADEPAPVPSDVASGTPTPEPTATEAPAAAVFLQPAECTAMLPQSRVDAFTAAQLTLLGGPGGLYPSYYADPTPEESAGGISCIWGNESVPGSTIEISVAPITIASRSVIIENLLEQGLNEAALDDGISYGQLGDESSAPAVLNVIRDDSWISVLEGVGGQAAFEEALVIAGEVHSEVYVTP